MGEEIDVGIDHREGASVHDHNIGTPERVIVREPLAPTYATVSHPLHLLYWHPDI